MTDDDKRAARRVPVVLRIKLRYKKVDTFISKFATNMSSTGMFISSRKPKPVGTEVKFELRLSDESPVVAGTGTVKWIREYDPDHPRQPHGMGIEFTGLNDESRALIERIVEHKRQLGVEDDGEIPRSEKKKTRRKSTRRKRKRPITYTPPDAAAEPAEPAQTAEPARTAEAPEPAPDPAPEPAPKTPAMKPPKPLEPRQRVVVTSVSEVIARATANTGSSNGEDWSESKLRELLEEELPSMDRIVARAKEIAGDVGSEAELAELTRVSATAVAESVHGASDALASLLGGTPVAAKRRRRANRVDPEPVEQAPEPVEQAPEPVDQAPEPVDQAPEAVEHEHVHEHVHADDEDPEFAEGTLDVPVAAEPEPEPQVEPEPEPEPEPLPDLSEHENPTVLAPNDYVEQVAARAEAAIDSALAAAEELDDSIPDFADDNEVPTAAEIELPVEPDPGASDDAIPIDFDDVVEEVDLAASPPQRASSIDAALQALESEGTLDDEIPIDLDDSDFAGEGS